MNAIPGKDALSAINTRLQVAYNITVTANSIISAMEDEEVPEEMVQLLGMLCQFATATPPETSA